MRAQLVGINRRITIPLNKGANLLNAYKVKLVEEPQNKKLNLYANITSDDDELIWTFYNIHPFIYDGTRVTVNNQSSLSRKTLQEGDVIGIKNERDYVKLRFEIKFDGGSLRKHDDPPPARKNLPITPALSI